MMKGVGEVSELTGLSKRTLQYYDQIGLLKPDGRTEGGYRLYDDAALQKLRQIMLLRSLEFPLKEIKAILENPSFDRQRALADQIRLLEMKKEHIESLIRLARDMQTKGEKPMDFSAFDTKKLEEYAARAKERWGGTKEFQEMEEKGRAKADSAGLARGMMDIFSLFGALRQENPAGEAAQALARELQDFITENCYACTPQILSSLGRMYVESEEFTRNIDAAGGEGTAAFAQQAIEIYCGKA